MVALSLIYLTRWHIIETFQDLLETLPICLLLLSEVKTFYRAGYKTNIQKSIVFLYISNEQSENEIKETIPFTIASKK